MPRPLFLVASGLTGLALVWVPLGEPTAHAAAAITVTTTGDNTTTDGQCSLREAIANANSDSAASPDCVAGSGADTIVFSLGATPATITLDAGLGALAPRGTVTIDGDSLVTVSGGDQTQIIDAISSGEQLTLQGLGVVHGRLASTGLGGAIDSRDGSLTIRDSTFAHNNTTDLNASGGAISQNGGSLTVSGSTFTDNHSQVGGAIRLNTGSVSITNSTFVGNSSANNGGAISSTNSGSPVFSYDTFVGNSSFFGGAISNTATVVASVFQGNATSSGGQCGSSVADGGYNVSSDTSCATAGTSLASTDAMLDAGGLADNTGPTQTVALVNGSPAIDLVPSGTAGCGTTTGVDQRGLLRPFDGDGDQTKACDAGAFEAGSRLPQRGSLQLSASTSSVGEGDGHATITVDRVDGSDGPVSVGYTTGDATATAPGDYTTTAGTLSFADGQTTATVDVPITDDHVQEPDETFTVTLSTPGGGATLGTPTTQTVTITDDDVAGTLQLSASTSSVGEGDGHATITVDRVDGSDGPVSVGYTTGDATATASGDYTTTAGTLSFADGQTTATVDVPITDDHVQEPDETFTVTLSTPGGGATLGTPTTQTVTITDDDKPLRCTIKGTPGDDVLRGTPGRDVICGGGGDDTLWGQGGNDAIHGGFGDDTIRGGRGRDLLVGWKGDDVLSGQQGRDDLRGWLGDDVLRGGPGRDVLRGGPGHDTLVQ